MSENSYYFTDFGSSHRIKLTFLIEGARHELSCYYEGVQFDEDHIRFNLVNGGFVNIRDETFEVTGVSLEMARKMWIAFIDKGFW